MNATLPQRTNNWFKWLVGLLLLGQLLFSACLWVTIVIGFWWLGTYQPSYSLKTSPTAPAPAVIAQGKMTTTTPFSASATTTIRVSPTFTLKPPPTLEPPTATPTATVTAIVTPSRTTLVTDNPVGTIAINGLEILTPTSPVSCQPRDDWQLRYTVQENDALANIAARYNTYASELATGNCLNDANLIQIGQELRVPGEGHPQTPTFDCIPYELISPVDNAYTIPGSGELAFSWRGPIAPLYLIRITQPNGQQYERLIELRQSEQIDIFLHLRQSGRHTWQVYPLGRDFLQIACAEGGPWAFYKAAPPTDTPTPTAEFTQVPTP